MWVHCTLHFSNNWYRKHGKKGGRGQDSYITSTMYNTFFLGHRVLGIGLHETGDQD